MKDIPHHMKKFNRNVERSAHREEIAEDEFAAAFRKPVTEKQKKKQTKEAKKMGKIDHLPYPKTPDEENDLRKHRTPQTRIRNRRAPPAK